MIANTDSNFSDEAQRMGTAFAESLAVLTTTLEDLALAFAESLAVLTTTLEDLALAARRSTDDRGRWNYFNPPESPRPRPDFDRLPWCRPRARPRNRPVSPRGNRARSTVGGKTAARRAA